MLSPAKRTFSGKNAATNLALLVLLMLKSNCVNELKVSDVDSSPEARQARHVSAREAVLEGLQEEKTIAGYRAAEGDARAK